METTLRASATRLAAGSTVVRRKDFRLHRLANWNLIRNRVVIVMPTHALGISAYFHDSAAALIRDGEILAAAQEERFTRVKQDAGFPSAAVKFCLQQAGIKLSAVDKIIFYERPWPKLARIISTYLFMAPRGLQTFIADVPSWLVEKAYFRARLRHDFMQISDETSEGAPQIAFAAHHASHAASAFYPSGYECAAVLCIDGVGEWATTSAWCASGSRLEPLWQLDFPHSIGLLYSAFTYFCGFRVDSGEYKLMGLAPYGRPIYADLILRELVDLKEDGSFRLNMKYFEFATGATMTGARFAKLFGASPRVPEAAITQRELDLAASIQQVIEDIVLRLTRTLFQETGLRSLCLAGGVALNCVCNTRLLREGPFERIWVQPASGDAGGALGAAYLGSQGESAGKRAMRSSDAMAGAYLGTQYSNDEIASYLSSVGAVYRKVPEREIIKAAAKCLLSGDVVGWFQGRMEFGPRALGARSILGDPRRPDMQARVNRTVKNRERFRPFAPAVLAERAREWFDTSDACPYMTFVAPVLNSVRVPCEEAEGLAALDYIRSRIPAVTHVDYSARLQTVHRESNRLFYELLEEFDTLTGCPVLLNTSFNVRGEPIVESPMDAYRCFMRSGLDWLVIGNCILDKKKQPKWPDDDVRDVDEYLD